MTPKSTPLGYFGRGDRISARRLNAPIQRANRISRDVDSRSLVYKPIGRRGGVAACGKIVKCDKNTGIATVKLFTGGAKWDLTETPADASGQTVTAYNGREGWHREGDGVVLFELENATGADYVIMDKIKGFTWDAPTDFVHNEYALDQDDECCIGLS